MPSTHAEGLFIEPYAEIGSMTRPMRYNSAMALGKDYELQDCPVARALELVGERWTILVIRDCFLGVRRFSDFLVHLDIPRAVLTSRLDRLVSEGMLERREYSLGRSEYLLTDRGRSLWPILHSLAEWGDQQAAPRAGRRRRGGRVDLPQQRPRHL